MLIKVIANVNSDHDIDADENPQLGVTVLPW